MLFCFLKCIDLQHANTATSLPFIPVSANTYYITIPQPKSHKQIVGLVRTEANKITSIKSHARLSAFKRTKGAALVPVTSNPNKL